MKAEMKMQYTRYARNCVRSAMAPETIVAVVAQNMVWKMRNAVCGMFEGTAEPSAKGSAMSPAKGSAPNIMRKPKSQKSSEPKQKSSRFFMRMLAVFFERVNPASTDANPICIMNIRIAASSTHTVSIPDTR